MNQQINPDTSQSQTEAGFDLVPVWNRLRNLLKAPVFEGDLEKTRKAALLNPIIIGAEIVFTLYSISLLLPSENMLVPIIIIPVIQALLISSFFALKRGIVHRTAIILVVVMALMILILSVLFGRVEGNPMLPGLLSVILLAGFLISGRAAVVLGVISLGYLLVFSYIDELVEMPSVLAITEQVYVSRMAVMFTMITVIVTLTVSIYSRIFRQVQASDEELRNTNEELRQVRSYLEQEVEANTRQLERRSRYLEAAAHVANASISLLNEQEMIQTVANEITKQFGFYHVGVFLLDERKEWAALRAASSEGGQRMISRNHRLAVGRQGIVGFVTSMGQARISQDTGLDRVHNPAEELPDTRSEMALPLIARGQIVGAIDIQDTQPEAFTRDDITVLQTMADQIALALENLRLYEQTQETLEEVRRVYGEYSQQAWRETQQKNLLSSYRYFGGAVTKLAKTDQPEVVKDIVSIPVEVRGITLGAIEISKGEDGANWSDEELRLLRSLADQIGIALDSARLFNESQLKATTEHTISQINSQLWETMDINTILRTTAQNLRQTLALPELTIRMSAPETDQEFSSNGSQEAEEHETGQETD